MASRPSRRADAQRVKHLDAHIQPVEDALLARADALDNTVSLETDGIDPVIGNLYSILAREFRAAADEIHYW